MRFELFIVCLSCLKVFVYVYLGVCLRFVNVFVQYNERVTMVLFTDALGFISFIIRRPNVR